MNEYTVILDCDDYPDYISYVLEAESFADAEAKALKVYDLNCYIISITRKHGSY